MQARRPPVPAASVLLGVILTLWLVTVAGLMLAHAFAPLRQAVD